MPKIASLFGLAGLLGMILARFLGTSAAVNNLLVASCVCLVLAGLLVLRGLGEGRRHGCHQQR